MVKFSEDDSLGKVISKKQMFCSIGIAPNSPIKDLSTLAFAAGAKMFSVLCGWTFTTAAPNAQYKSFIIAFVSKIRSRIYRKATANPSQWYIFRPINVMRQDVLDKKACLINYGFDVDKFFQSDEFKKGVALMQRVVAKGIDDAKKFQASRAAEKDPKLSFEAKEAGQYIKALEDAFPLITSTTCNDKYWKLQKHDLVTEFDNSNEASRFKCKVTKTKEDGEDVWEVNELDGFWVATFHDEESAKAFAEEYPTLKLNYIKDLKARTNEADEDSLNESSNPPLKWNKMIDQIKEKCMLVISNVVNAQKDFSPAEEIVEQLQRELDYYAFSDINSEGSIYDSYFNGWSKGTSIMAASNESSTQKSEEEIDEQELDAKIEDAMKKIYDAEDKNDLKDND